MRRDDRDLSASRVQLGTSAAEEEEGEAADSGYESDPYGDQYRADLKTGEATNAMIDSLKRIHWWAIYRKYGIATIWDFPNSDFLSVLETAQAELEKKLRANVATCSKFY